ncbi:MAG: VPLPA-CTERM sorting domain-containing protein, partial [Proteobacteria bacterium]|nr:VPLPA-CTERM sorting domain-containing protein [Pseudomonadota bacterium]
IQSGTLVLDVAQNCEAVSLWTTNDLVIDVNFDLSPEDMLLKYTASIDVNIKVFNFLNVPMRMSDIQLGSFAGIDPSGFLGDGTLVKTYSGSERINARFGQYALTDALFEYDMVITPDMEVADRYAISIDTFSISEGNTSQMFWSVLNELSGSGMVPAGVDLTPPFQLFGPVSGSIDIQADPVPVPGSLWLLGAGVLGLTGLKRRRV